ncbi:MAG: thioredoxin family protein [Ketobacter sp.]|nr:MAG: thioredoxin family protein [Ketobacter sp.]
MKAIKVLGSGCTKCNKTADSIKHIAEELGVEILVEKESDPQVMMSFGVMSTPAVVVDDKLVHSGSIPHRADIETWLKS